MVAVWAVDVDLVGWAEVWGIVEVEAMTELQESLLDKLFVGASKLSLMCAGPACEHGVRSFLLRWDLREVGRERQC